MTAVATLPLFTAPATMPTACAVLLMAVATAVCAGVLPPLAFLVAGPLALAARAAEQL
ncbi:hypothetical protein [Streptomyces sp. 6N223]|uniref:hypothetical protein n=1 Tax=Streptomyces sp. 6N223 TaxID=3457412 RepID=UPI003FCEEC2D